MLRIRLGTPLFEIVMDNDGKLYYYLPVVLNHLEQMQKLSLLSNVTVNGHLTARNSRQTYVIVM